MTQPKPYPYWREGKQIFLGHIEPTHIADATSEEQAQELIDILNNSTHY